MKLSVLQTTGLSTHGTSAMSPDDLLRLLEEDLDTAIAEEDDAQRNRHGVTLHSILERSKERAAAEQWTDEQKDKLHQLIVKLLRDIFKINVDKP